MNCPECDRQLRSDVTACRCGWKKDGGRIGPDYARIAADRERSRARLFEAYTGPRACQERRCVERAVQGTDFCPQHTGVDVERVRRPGWMKNPWKDAA